MGAKMIIEKSGKLSNGQMWSWSFGGRIELMSKDDPLPPVLVTYFNTLSDEPFEDESFQDTVWNNERFDATFGGNKELRKEYDDVCWSCYQHELDAYNLVLAKVVKVVKERVRKRRENRPDNMIIGCGEFDDIVAEIIDEIQVDGELKDDSYWWLFDGDGPISRFVDEQVEELLEGSGYEMEFK